MGGHLLTLCVLVLLLLGGTGCTTVIRADLRQLLDREDFPVSMDKTPEGVETIGLVATRDTGFYPFGFVPVIPMSMQSCVDEMVRQARRLGGHGISQIAIDYDQATSFLSWSVIFIPDWFGSVTITGSVWRRPTAATSW